MREVWIVTGTSPTTFRYVDWLLTVPLQIIEFYLILTAIAVVRSALFWKLMVASIVMLVFGYFGEIRSINVWGAFVVSMLAWLFIIYEVFLGEASKISAENGTEASKKAFNALRIIVTVGWAIYPLGYVLGYTGGGSENMLNIVYNLADFVNKIAFGVVIWAAATSSSHEQTS
jgi:bacteriorhodopsin